MSKVYFISDTHFNHKNILKYEPCRITATLNYARAKLHEQYAAKVMTSADEELNISFAKQFDYLDYLQSAAENGTLNDFTTKQLLLMHDDMIIEKWNKIVKPDDVVWFLGDFAFGPRETVKSYAAKLHGRKRMIMGNHDCYPKSFYESIGFEYVSRYPIILRNWFILSHAPNEYINENTPYFYVYGHIHSSELFPTTTEHSRCVCVERQNFEPIEIEEFNEAEGFEI